MLIALYRASPPYGSQFTAFITATKSHCVHADCMVQGESLIYIAAANGYTDTMRFLIDGKGDVNARNAKVRP